MKKLKPIVIKIVKIFLPDAVPAKEGEPVFTQRGLFRKLLFYGAFYVVSILIFFVPLLIEKLTNVSVDFSLAETSLDNLTWAQLILLMICIFIESLMPFLRFLTKLIPVTRAIYVFSNGYFFTYTALMSVNKTSVLARTACLLISFCIAVMPYFMYRYMHIRLPRMTAKIVYIAFFVSIFASSIVKLLSAVGNPGGIVTTINTIGANSAVTVLLSVFQIVLSVLFLILAYETCVKYIRLKVSKKLEWAAFFAIIYTTFKLYNTVARVVLYRWFI